jgi:cell wall-associated NlpC family hydrolase
MAEPVEVGLSQVPQQAKDSTSLAQKDPAPVSARPDSPSASQEEEAPSLADQVIAYARTFTGTPYKLGASGPSKFDCSGFTRYVFKKFGYELTQYSGAQFREGREVAGYSDLQKGDLVFFGKRGSVRNIGHVGIVVSVDEESGSFTFIHASVSNGVIEQSSSHPYFLMRYMGARRILPDEPRK